MPHRYEFPSTTNCTLAKADLENFGYEVSEATDNFDTLVVKAEDSDDVTIDDIIHRYGAYKVDHSDDEPDEDDLVVEEGSTGDREMDERNEEDRQRERDMNVSTPR